MRIRLLLLFFLAGIASVSAQTNRISANPLPRAHAHNDYEHARPLFEALEHGFCSVEADVHLVSNKLFVAHDRNQVREDRELHGLYLRPMKKLADKTGRIFPGEPTLLLFVDVKSDAEMTYLRLRDYFRRCSPILTKFSGDKIETNVVTVIISGNRARATMAKETERFAAMDGRIEDLDSNASIALIPMISDNWTKYFKWRGVGPMPEEERIRLREFVTKAHKQGRKIRFWETPDKPALWKELVAADVDLIGTDDLDALEKFLRTPRS